MKINLCSLPVSYINLERDTEKRSNMDSILSENKFKSITRLRAVEPAIAKYANERKTLGNIYGCSLSHSQALLVNTVPFIILEDDVNILKFKKDIEIPDDADALYLGNMSWGLVGNVGHNYKVEYEKVQGYTDIYRVQNLLGTHAIAYLSDRYVKACWNSLTNSYKNINVATDDIHPDSIASDVAFAKIHPQYNVYAIGTPVFYQTGYYENATNKHIAKYKEE